MRRAPLLLLAMSAAAARAGDAVPSDAAPPDAESFWDRVEGEIRAGFRVISGEGEGRFRQDRSLDDGPRVFDLSARAEAAEGVTSTSWEVDAHGLGESNQDARFRVSSGGFDAQASWMRDDYEYRATGDPFPYDTLRDRSTLRFRYAPSRDWTFRLDLDRNLRRGDAYTIGYTDRREAGAPPGVDPDKVLQHRPLDQRADGATLGFDAKLGEWRVSLSQSVRATDVDDTRSYVIPPSRRTAAPVSEDLRRDVSSDAWTTVAKAARTFFDGALDVTAIGSWTKQPTDGRISGEAEGFEPIFDTMGMAAKGEYEAVLDGGSRIRRSRVDARVESVWHATDDLDIVAAGELDETTDDARLESIERRDYDRTDVPDETITDRVKARITDRSWRASLEGDWEVAEGLRLRVGGETLTQDVSVPVDSRGGSLLPTDYDSTSFRTILGADWKAAERLRVHVLAKLSQNDEPQSNPGPETGDDTSVRVGWYAADDLHMTATWRHKGFRVTEDFDSAARTDSAGLALGWTPEGWNIAPSFTWQTSDTRTDTTFFSTAGGGFSTVAEDVRFTSRSGIASLRVQRDLTKSLRIVFSGTRIDTGGDYEAAWDEASLGAEHDISDTVTIGVRLLSWRLDERGTNTDDYRAVGAEMSATVRF
ncbi:MAG: hypothetical protein HMLKMBBP_02000 [Planctomycetes bacterium]|nr:hypothetical protein [Planctomycetota bacterium]